MTEVTLIFPSLNALWGFIRECKVNYVDVIKDKKALVCKCAEADIEIAMAEYGAISELKVDVPGEKG